MKSLYPSLVFPDTDIFSYRQFPLLLFSTPVYYLQPVETEGVETENDGAIFISSGLCQAHTPAPLGEDRDRFQRLIHDIEFRKDDYAAQLSSLTMAAMSSKKDMSSREKRYQIISSLLGSDAAVPAKDGEDKLDLWQARLVLAVAEILQKEEAELNEELQLLDSQELEMYRSLKGGTGPDETDPFSELEQITARLNSARPQEMKMRFRSWLKFMRTAPIPDISLFIASSVDSSDQLINEFEKTNDHAPVPVLELPLPDRIEASPKYVAARIKDFHRDAVEVRGSIAEDLNRLIGSDSLSGDSTDNLLPTSHKYLDQWSELIEEHFPAGSHGRSSLVFYLLPHCNIAKLLQLDTSGTSRQDPHGLYGVIKR